MQTLITDVAVTTMIPDQSPYGLIRDGAVAIDTGVIRWVGPHTDCPCQFAAFSHHGFEERVVTPALIDCHAHVVHGGNCSQEFELRLNGASYEEVARAGGGIVSTVSATRAATEAALLADALVRIDALIAEGVSTVEIKSGYGLDAKLMAASGTVAVLLRGAFFALRETELPPVGAFRTHKVPMAVATDWNPGTSPLGSLQLVMNMVCTLFRLTPEEALAGATRHAAQALGLKDRGMICPGLRADLAIWDVAEAAELSYRIGVNSRHTRICGGTL